MIGTSKICVHFFPPFPKCLKFLGQLLLSIIWKNIFRPKKRKFLDRIFFPISKCIITIDPPLNSMVAGKIDMQRQSMYCLSRVVLTWYFYALLKISETNSSRNSDAKLNSTDPSCMHILTAYILCKKILFRNSNKLKNTTYFTEHLSQYWYDPSIWNTWKKSLDLWKRKLQSTDLFRHIFEIYIQPFMLELTSFMTKIWT